jgi:hypothetical protein
MNWCHIVVGFAVSIIGGEIVLRPLIEYGLWPYAGKKHGFDYNKKAHLSGAVGMVERLLYTGALVFGSKELIGVWLAIKVAARWQSSEEAKEKPDSDNIWLIGTGLSLMFGFVGAWVALGQIPK